MGGGWIFRSIFFIFTTFELRVLGVYRGQRQVPGSPQRPRKAQGGSPEARHGPGRPPLWAEGGSSGRFFSFLPLLSSGPGECTGANGRSLEAPRGPGRHPLRAGGVENYFFFPFFFIFMLLPAGSQARAWKCLSRSGERFYPTNSFS